MKKILTMVTFCLLCSGAPANALSISTSATGDLFGDVYGYKFTIDDDYHATLTNTSSNSLSGALIHLIKFNMNPALTLGADFTIGNVMPDWIFMEKGGYLEFDYAGVRKQSSEILAPGEVLSFDFNFINFTPNPANPFALWMGSDSMAGGTSTNGESDVGQVAVAFMGLGAAGVGSDLLASDWRLDPPPYVPPAPSPKPPPVYMPPVPPPVYTPPVPYPDPSPVPSPSPAEPTPEPGTILLLASGLIGLFWIRGRKRTR